MRAGLTRWRPLVNKTLIALAALLALTVSADAAGRDKTWRNGWKQSVGRPDAQPSLGTIEGRNAAAAAPMSVGIEPYIAHAIEQDARSSR